MILKATAQRIAGEWHGGQWTNLYAFCSSGNLLTTKQAALKEISNCIAGPATKQERDKLHKLYEYVFNNFPDHPEGPFYAELDEASALYCVFHADTGKANASYAGMPEAEDRAKEMNAAYLKQYENK